MNRIEASAYDTPPTLRKNRKGWGAPLRRYKFRPSRVGCRLLHPARQLRDGGSRARPFAAAQGFACGFSPQYAQKPARTGDPDSRYAHARITAQGQILLPHKTRDQDFACGLGRPQSGSNCQRTLVPAAWAAADLQQQSIL
ncbi:MAG TPA: hypothetical protein VG488_03830 [Candidatus Angelobacter sp.]|nr:hypothetical protein [Candidatus Angelobacter sp.]